VLDLGATMALEPRRNGGLELKKTTGDFSFFFII
jgi:hypothetical protein